MEPDKYSPYHVPTPTPESDVTHNLDDIRNMMVPIMDQAMDIIKCGHHIVSECHLRYWHSLLWTVPEYQSKEYLVICQLPMDSKDIHCP